MLGRGQCGGRRGVVLRLGSGGPWLVWWRKGAMLFVGV